jgi:hypothetical protein
MSTHRVLLVRPWDTARVGSGCCSGATGGLCVEGWHEDPEAARDRASRQPLGEVYRALRASLPGDVAVEIVDAQNTVFLLPAILRDARRHGLPWPEALRQMVRGHASAAIIVDGRMVSRSRLPTPERAVRIVQEALGTRTP